MRFFEDSRVLVILGATNLDQMAMYHRVNSEFDTMLIQYPENGLHPVQIGQRMKEIRQTSDDVRVIILTFSPLVVNCCEPEEVVLLSRNKITGELRAVMMKDTIDFEERSKVFSLGELWLSYLDGDQEVRLIG